MSLYRLNIIRSQDGETAELFCVQTDELIARGTPEEVKKVLTRLLGEAAQEGTADLGNLRAHGRGAGPAA
jgi:hypothetical protein